MADIVIIASAFGTIQVREQGYHVYAPLAASVGVAGFEVWRELSPTGLDGTVSADSLAALGRLMAAHGLWAVYSTPATSYTDIGALDMVTVRGALIETQTLDARIVKPQLGGFAGDASAELLARLLQGWRTRVLAENGQQAVGGSLSQFQGLFGALEAADVIDMLGMMFNVGNWEWAGETPLTYTQALAPYVEYVHCKSVAGEGACRFAATSAGNDARFVAVLATPSGDVSHDIEFPFNAVDPVADAHQHVVWLKAA